MAGPSRRHVMTTEYLSETEAAKRGRVSPQYLKKLRCVGGGPAFIKVGGGRRVIYDVADLDQWMASSKFHSTSEVTQSRADQAGRA